MKYLLCGYYGYGNLGDDLMLEIIADRIALANKANKIYVKCNSFSGFDQEVLAKITPVCVDGQLLREGNRVINRLTYMSKLLKIISRMDVIIIGGGGLFLDKGKHNSNLFTLLFISVVARFLGKKVFIVGVGIDYLRHPLSKIYIKLILKCANKVYIREKYGFKLAKSLIFNRKDKLFLTRDILYVKEVATYLGSKTVPVQSSNIGVSLMDYYLNYEPSQNKRNNFITEFVKFLGKITKEGILIELLIFQDKEGERDDRIAEDVLRGLGPDGTRLAIKRLKTFEDVSEVYKNLGLVIGMRYHSLVFSSLFNRPFIGINHERKIKEVCLDFGMPYIEKDDLSADGLCNKMIDLIRSGKRPVVTEEVVNKAELNFSFLKG